jgi:hypothetical protein
MAAGGGRVEATPSARADIGSDMGGDEMVSVLAFQRCASDSPH